jgi:hypothetical protein
MTRCNPDEPFENPDALANFIEREVLLPEPRARFDIWRGKLAQRMSGTELRTGESRERIPDSDLD